MTHSTPAAFAVLLLPSFASADVRLPAVIGDHMVLQQRTDAPLWGWAEPGEEVTVAASWGANARAVADESGTWRVKLATPEAGGPHSIEVSGKNRIVLSDVLAGEVWLCSGQSNMEMSISGLPPGYYGIAEPESVLAEADHQRIRLFDVTNAIAPAPKNDCEGTWRPCSRESLATFSAVGYFFGAELEGELGAPIGLVAANWGGTVAESWTSATGLASFPEFEEEVARAARFAAEPDAPRDPVAFHANTATALFNGMIAPLVPYAIRGAIWYQGESNIGRAEQYRRLFPALIADWRAHFGRGDFPFYYVQIAPYRYQGDRGHAAELRDAQRLTLAVPNTGMAVTMDIGDPDDIHPKEKREVGWRLARWALARTYGDEDLQYSGPLYRSMSSEGASIRIEFDHADVGLTALGGDLTHFTIAGADRRFVAARALIEGKSVLVSSPEVPQPHAVRYGWGAADEPNLFNAAGLPASSFRTDDWPVGGE